MSKEYKTKLSKLELVEHALESHKINLVIIYDNPDLESRVNILHPLYKKFQDKTSEVEQ